MEESRSFPAEITSPRAARIFVSGLLGHPEEETSQVALVLTSELVTNAVVHARTRVGVRVELEPDLVRVEVSDGDPRLPGPSSYSPDGVGAADGLSGRGLFLVQTLASAWGSDTCPDGKVVWFTLDSGHQAGRRAC